MGQAKDGDTVKLHYTGKLRNGEVFDSSKDSQPLKFTIGNGEVMPGIEKGIIGMEIGDTKTIEIPTEDALGPRREELVVDVERSDFPEDMTLSVGQRIQMRHEDGDPMILTVTDMKDNKITLDANHPLAGEALVFDVELVEIA
jgi:FKBP-type peptidyl-prolyl cis-trans isomerase 2